MSERVGARFSRVQILGHPSQRSERRLFCGIHCEVNGGVLSALNFGLVTLEHIYGHSRTVSFTVISVSIRYAIFIAAFVLLTYCGLAMKKSVATPPFWRNF